MTLSGEPVLASAALNPVASASMATNTVTTRPIDTAVIAVEAGRCMMLRRL